MGGVRVALGRHSRALLFKPQEFEDAHSPVAAHVVADKGPAFEVIPKIRRNRFNPPDFFACALASPRQLPLRCMYWLCEPSLEEVPLSLYVRVPSLVELLDRVGERICDPSCELRVSGEETWVLPVVGVVASYAVL